MMAVSVYTGDLRRAALLVAVATVGCGTFKTPLPAAPRAAPSEVRAIILPGAPPTGEVFMDYIAYDRAHHRVWVPAGNTGSVDVVDAGTDRVTRIDGFSTAEVERRGAGSDSEREFAAISRASFEKSCR